MQFKYKPRRAIRAAVPLAGLSMLGMCLCSVVGAAPDDIVPQISTIRNALARFAADGLLKADADQLLNNRLLTRADAARYLEDALGLNKPESSVSIPAGDAAAARNALIALRPELMADHIDVDRFLKSFGDSSLSYLGAVQPELRIDTGSKNSSGSGFDGIYRGTVFGGLSRNLQFAVLVSNSAEDERRVFTNDAGPSDWSALTQAYLNYSGWHGLNVLIGRTDDNWGPGIEGGALISDNAPPQDQIRVSFPFSLGSRLGRDWNYTQFASTYDEDGQRKYLQARRIEINFSKLWSAQYEESLKSTSSSLLGRAPLPFLIAKGVDLGSDESQTEFIANIGAQYLAGRYVRTYGQLLINDIKSPFRGNFAGFDVGQGGTTPQRLAYVAGAGYNTRHGTNAAVEYSTADPTTYQDTRPSLAWTEGQYNYLGLPDGPNFKQIDAQISQDVTSKVTLSAEERYRTRFSNSYPAPNAQDLALAADYHFDRRNSFTLTFHDYHQSAYPYAPGSPLYPVNTLTPPTEGNPGSNLTVHELDAAYELVF